MTLDELRIIFARFDDSVWIYPAAWTEKGITTERTPYGDGWNAAVKDMSKFSSALLIEMKKEIEATGTVDASKVPPEPDY